MEQYEVLMAKELFVGSDIIRKFTYITMSQGKAMLFWGKQVVLYVTHHEMR